MTGRLVLVRHGQSYGNVERRLDTLPPGAALTDLGHRQARTFARDWTDPIAMVAHSVATRARETAAGIAGHLDLAAREFDGIHEVQVGDLENRNDDEAIKTFESVYRSWHFGDLDVPVPGGETGRQVLDRVIPVLTELRRSHLDDDRFHGDIVLVSHGAAIRLVASVLAGVDSAFALDHHLNNTESVVLDPLADGRWSCLRWGPLTPPFYPPAQPARTDTMTDEETLDTAGPMG
ncbi:histidine phosphatase family protein [Mycobacterium sp. AMU20-3851]|uniref:histidine phosphatase family protein n=1 Tax=Mycobacterium sp. AMU20-3851 TaxID=3122055 RepID=UPI003754E4CC